MSEYGGTGKKKFNQANTFPVPVSLRENKKNTIIFTNTPSKDKIMTKAFQLHAQGDILKAAKYYQNFINQGFDDYRVFTNYGVILNDLGKLKDAAISQRKAIALKPDYADSHCNLGTILKNLGNLKEAEISTRKAISLNPNYSNAHLNLGSILIDLGNLQEAEIYTRNAIKLNPNNPWAHSNLGIILCDLGKLQEAAISQRKAIELNPNFAEAHSTFGTILKNLGNVKEAEFYTRKAIELNPNIPEAHTNLGTILKNLDNLKEAESSHRKAIELNPNFAEAHSNLGSTLKDLGNLKEAEYHARKAIELTPDNAEAHYCLSHIELLQDNYQNGLKSYEFRFRKKRPVIPHTQTKIKKKDNKEFRKGEKLLVVSEQGLGDTLLFMRYVPYLRKQGLDISFCAQTKLHSLIKKSAIDPNPLTSEQSTLVTEGEWIPLLSLPRHLQVNPKNPIISEPYIFTTDELKSKWKNILNKEKKPIVGINWQGNKNMEKRCYQGRSIPLEKFSILSDLNDIKILSFQKGFGSEQLNNCSFKNKFVECQSQVDSTWDFLENAAIIENCDLIITCDTAIAHLAGGMGKKVWLLLRDIPFWTWGLNGKSTFWYPSMRLFRQKERHNWGEVMERVSNEIKAEIC
tara:strand:+ start:787 stop:2676 length:1890 start_codon:yes stop_codon:yes gene_type:complete